MMSGGPPPKAPGDAGGVLLLTRQVLDPTYKPDVFQEPVQRLAFIRMIGMARYTDNGTLRRGQLCESVRQLSVQCEMSLGGMARLLARLEEDGTIARQKAAHPRVPDTITIVNFEAWQDSLGGYFNGTHNGTQVGTREKPTRRARRAPKKKAAGTQSGTQVGTSLTKEERGDNEERNTASAADASAPVPWSTSACDSWIEHMGGIAPGGEIGGHLKPLVEKYGADEVLEQWGAYLAAHVRQHRAPFAKPADFAQRYGYYKKHGHKMGTSGRRPKDVADATSQLLETRRQMDAVPLGRNPFDDR